MGDGDDGISGNRTRIYASRGSYIRSVASIHRKYQASLKRAKSRQQILNAYWKYKKDSERLLAKRLKEEMGAIKRIKDKMEYR